MPSLRNSRRTAQATKTSKHLPNFLSITSTSKSLEIVCYESLTSLGVSRTLTCLSMVVVDLEVLRLSHMFPTICLQTLSSTVSREYCLARENLGLRYLSHSKHWKKKNVRVVAIVSRTSPSNKPKRKILVTKEATIVRKGTTGTQVIAKDTTTASLTPKSTLMIHLTIDILEI